MECFLHIGTEKTGSSFIQTSFALNRDYLLAHGFWYPTAGAREKDMIQGRISPGNASNLAVAIKEFNRSKVVQLLKNWKTETKQKGCEKLILSNELLVGALAPEGSFSWFKELLKETGIELSSVLLVFREPVGQALSLYKHRSKNGTSGTLEHWLNKKFEYIDVLQKFKVNVLDQDESIDVRGYTKDGGKLLEIFYTEWLSVAIPDNIQKSEVNPSLTLSELAYLASIRRYSKWMALDVYNLLISIPSSEKSDDHYAKKWAKGILTNHLIKKADLWHYYNELLPIDEQIKLPQAINEEKEVKEEIYSFSKRQIDEIAAFASAQRSLATKAGYFFKALRWRLGKLKSLLIK